jgi:phage shock protein B
MSEIILVPFVLFMIFVAPLWVFMHYATQAKKMKSATPEDRENMEQLWKLAAVMEERLDNLESILDGKYEDRRTDHV